MGKTRRDIKRWARIKWWRSWFPRGFYENSAHKTRDCLREEDHAYEGFGFSGMYAGSGLFKRLERRRQRYRARREMRSFDESNL